MTRTEQIIDGMKNEITEAVSRRLTDTVCKGDKEVIWKEFQTIVAEVVTGALLRHLPETEITSPKTKSTYPDVKIRNSEGLFAIDIKSNESAKNPWFDMARLDTIFSERIDVYRAEWELVIKYDSATGKFIKAYFMRFREAVGIRPECNGVKYRPYDGKVRPKDWADFDSGRVFWTDEEEYHKAIRRSIINRWRNLIKDTLVPQLSPQQRKEFAALFED